MRPHRGSSHNDAADPARRSAGSVRADGVLWHDLECGAYVADLPLWRELAAAHGGLVLDVGAGTGRVALDLARRGFDVVAVDRDGPLLAALAERAAAEGLAVETVCCDARELALDRAFALVLVPMQTLQLLGGAKGRARFVARAKGVLAPGGVLAAALADALEAVDGDDGEPPLPDLRELDGTLFASRPVAVRDLGDRAVIERIREVVHPDGQRDAEQNVVELDHLDSARLSDELRAAGLAPLAPRRIPPTDDYIGSTVVIARA